MYVFVSFFCSMPSSKVTIPLYLTHKKINKSQQVSSGSLLPLFLCLCLPLSD